MEENVKEPVDDNFPDLSQFSVLVHKDGTYLLGAGMLADGLIVPLFPDPLSAEEIIKSLSDDPRRMELSVGNLGDPFKAMRKAAGEGAAGFQFSPGVFTDDQREAVFAVTQGRILFPFMTRYAEAGSQWPTVLGSALLCDEGCYLTRKGAAHFGPHDLMQWIRWDILDRASAKLSQIQPFRSHEPHEPFWCISHEEGHVNFTDGTNWYSPEGNTIVLFAKDSAVGPFMPPEGYYPVFNSEDAASDFLEGRMGGAFHIMSLVKSDIPNLIRHQGVMSSELGPKGELRAVVRQVDNLVNHLSQVKTLFSLPPYSSFVINPAGHREDTAWGVFPELDSDDLRINSIGASWKLTPSHEYVNLSRFDQFMGHDTFFLGPMDFQVSDLGRSLGRFEPIVDGEDLRSLTPIEAKEIIRDLICGRYDEVDFWSSLQGADDSWQNFDTNDGMDSVGHPNKTLDIHMKFMGKWVINFWDTVDGEKLGPFYLEGPFELANALCALELEDRTSRISGRRGHGSIGFDGSGNPDLEAATGDGLKNAIIEICVRMVSRGYRPSDALDMAAASNRILKSFRVGVCGNTADILISHIPTEARSTEQLLGELNINPDLYESLLTSVKAEIDPQGEQLLLNRIGKELHSSLLLRSKLFLSTALLQFQNLGRSPCLDYAPVSVQIVKALEYELRELASHLVFGFLGDRPVGPSREEDTFFYVRENLREKVSLGSITYAIKSLKSPKTSILKYAAQRLADSGLTTLSDRSTMHLILEDVLKKYRNGGAHESAISYETCEACIRDLIGSIDRPGLVFRVASWRQRGAHKAANAGDVDQVSPISADAGSITSSKPN
jgi:hypothetical protein